MAKVLAGMADICLLQLPRGGLQLKEIKLQLDIMSCRHIRYWYIGSLSLASYHKYDLGGHRTSLSENETHGYGYCAIYAFKVELRVRMPLPQCGMGTGLVKYIVHTLRNRCVENEIDIQA